MVNVSNIWLVDRNTVATLVCSSFFSTKSGPVVYFVLSQIMCLVVFLSPVTHRETDWVKYRGSTLPKNDKMQHPFIWAKLFWLRFRNATCTFLLTCFLMGMSFLSYPMSFPLSHLFKEKRWDGEEKERTEIFLFLIISTFTCKPILNITSAVHATYFDQCNKMWSLSHLVIGRPRTHTSKKFSHILQS